ncbi:glycoside hydrolase family 3 protein [Calocera viscosa TUFC12733]|uniref:beta-glucosidase n=1 Tax=Calocera viscosa (strain TUFC12733) TaxID=1330018 RepID=A0A167FQT2_CALVF|nr:glycoside hydrolase family 3 protein [Calocera viscosa TUFC12733]
MSKPSDFKNADLDELVKQLSTAEACELITGVGNWYTAEIPRLKIPQIKVSDGPNGIRGNKFFNGTPAKSLPCATGLAATWDTDLIGEAAAVILAAEGRLKSAAVLLGPTCNIQRSPLGGRSFESFSEDPHLNGMMAAFYISNLQKNGISACIKHFVCNDQEHERVASDSLVSERALRELYLYPFMLAQKYAEPWAYMTSYNRINGTHCSENPRLLEEILRKEWGYDGLVMSDWYGVYSVVESVKAGLDLEMPGVDGWRQTSKLIRSVESQKLTVEEIKARAKRVLQLVQRIAKASPEILDGDQQERSSDPPEHRALLRKVAASSIVLLKNENDVLPLDTKKIKKLAIIGPNAKAAVIGGGGSASMKASYIITPFDGITAALPKDVEVTFAEGCQAHNRAPTLEQEIVTEDGRPGWIATFYEVKADGSLTAPVDNVYLEETYQLMTDADINLKGVNWWAIFKGKLRPRKEKIKFQFGLTVAGRAKLFVNDKLLIDVWTKQRRGEAFFNTGTEEEFGTVVLEAGSAADIRLEFCNLSAPTETDASERPNPNAGIRLGGFEVYDEEEALQQAVNVAKSADAVIVVVGLNADWESEGYDRKDLELPRKTNELVDRIAKANSNHVVVMQSGSAVTMPWVHNVSALVQAWYLGNETGNAIADVLFGKVNPSGKMSITFPKRLEDVPSFLNYGNQNGKVRYAEDLFVGYKHYQSHEIKTLFPFGYGLSYTTFEYSNLDVSKPTTKKNDFTATVKLTVTNTGKLIGSEAVQLYITPPEGLLARPALALKAFSKARDIPAGKDVKITLELDKYAVSYYDDKVMAWRADKGEYGVLIGASSEDIKLKGTLVLEESFIWTGL